MAQKTIKAHMKQRRDTKANWASINPVLLDGELGIVSDDPNLYKVGNGATAWNDLPFRGFDGTIVHQTGTSENAVMSQKATTAALDATKQETTQQVQVLVRTKADQDGKYPQLTAGFANNLVGRGEAVDATIGFRASGGTSIEDGAARVKELQGNAVVWNNFSYPLTDEEWGTYNSTNATATFINGEATITIHDLSKKSYNIGLCLKRTTSVIQGHKMLYLADIKSSKAMNMHVEINNNPTPSVAIGTSWTNFAAFVTTDRAFTRMTLCPNDVFDDTNNTYSVRNVRLYDLTLMFGAGNEPTTIEEFYARMPIGVDVNAYNEGEVISMNAEGIKSVGFNAWDEQWELGRLSTITGQPNASSSGIRPKNYIKVLPNTKYYCGYDMNPIFGMFFDENYNLIKDINGDNFHFINIRKNTFTTPINAAYMRFYTANDTTYNHDICINLSHTGYRNGEYQPYMEFVRNLDTRIKEAFPNGMMPWDKVYNKNGKGYIVKGSKGIAMNTITGWGVKQYSTHTTLFANAPKDAFNQGDYSKDSLLCSNTPSATWSDIYAARAQGIGMADGYIRVYIDGLTDVESAQAYFQDATLWYELAEPTIIEYDEPFNLDYEVWDFGTEQMIASQPSAPIKAKIAYGFNAVDSVRTAQIEIAELKTQIAQMQAAMASLASQPVALTE